MTTSVVSAQYCRSGGSVWFESDIVSFSRLFAHEQHDAVATYLVRSSRDKAVVLLPDRARAILAAPFDCPSVVPLDSQVSHPVQPRRTVFIQDLGDYRLSLTASIPVALDSWPGSVTACCYDLEDFGAGEDEFSAVGDLKASLVDLYFLLKSDADRLGPLPQRQWDYLRTIVRENG